MEYETNYGSNSKPLSYYLKRFLLFFLGVVVLIFVLLWGKSLFNPLYDRIFADNINTMKEVATSYYTLERLPKKVGESDTLTLQDMLDMKLLLAIKDKNGDMCDTQKSYVTVTKMDNEYKMKVNLVCGDEEDYIIVYMGCYDYCLNFICEKKEEEKKTTSSSVKPTVNKPSKPSKPSNPSKPDPKPENPKPECTNKTKYLYSKRTEGSFWSFCKSEIISSEAEYLLAGFFCIALKVICSSPSGISGFISLRGLGLACICIIATETALSASNGSRPVSIS